MTMGPKPRDGRHPRPEEDVNEPSGLIEKESADIERENPIDHDEPVEQAGEQRIAPPTFEE